MVAQHRDEDGLGLGAPIKRAKCALINQHPLLGTRVGSIDDASVWKAVALGVAPLPTLEATVKGLAIELVAYYS